jgi:hypothetical protein
LALSGLGVALSAQSLSAPQHLLSGGPQRRFAAAICFRAIAQFKAAEKRQVLVPPLGHNPYINAIMSPIVIRVYRPVTVRPRQRSALTLSDGSLICLTGTALLRAVVQPSVHSTSCATAGIRSDLMRDDERNSKGVPSTEHLNSRAPRNLLSCASAGGVPTKASSASQRLAATGPLTGGDDRFAI